MTSPAKQKKIKKWSERRTYDVFGMMLLFIVAVYSNDLGSVGDDAVVEAELSLVLFCS